MNPEELKHATAVMLRASQGELVEWTDHGRTDWKLEIRGVEKILWDFHAYAYRILDFPEPPQGQKWHNPANLTATQVGVHGGWRLLLECELDSRVRHDLERFCDGKWLPTPKELFPNPNGVCGLRTKSPLPGVKVDPMKAAWEENRAENHEKMVVLERSFVDGWQACEKHFSGRMEPIIKEIARKLEGTP